MAVRGVGGGNEFYVVIWNMGRWVDWWISEFDATYVCYSSCHVYYVMHV